LLAGSPALVRVIRAQLPAGVSGDYVLDVVGWADASPVSQGNDNAGGGGVSIFTAALQPLLAVPFSAHKGSAITAVMSNGQDKYSHLESGVEIMEDFFCKYFHRPSTRKLTISPYLSISFRVAGSVFDGALIRVVTGRSGANSNAPLPLTLVSSRTVNLRTQDGFMPFATPNTIDGQRGKMVEAWAETEACRIALGEAKEAYAAAKDDAELASDQADAQPMDPSWNKLVRDEKRRCAAEVPKKKAALGAAQAAYDAADAARAARGLLGKPLLPYAFPRLTGVLHLLFRGSFSLVTFVAELAYLNDALPKFLHHVRTCFGIGAASFKVLGKSMHAGMKGGNALLLATAHLDDGGDCLHCPGDHTGFLTAEKVSILKPVLQLWRTLSVKLQSPEPNPRKYLRTLRTLQAMAMSVNAMLSSGRRPRVSQSDFAGRGDG
jgi:hypothetical protein